MKIHTVRTEPLTSQGFAPFGQVIGADELVIDANNGERLTLDILTKDYEPLDIKSFNRHFKATQAQVALDGRPSVILVAPPEVELDRLEDLDAIRAFTCDGTVGYNLKIGTWHSGAHPLMSHIRIVNLQGHAPSVDIEIRDLGKSLDAMVQVLL